MSTKTFTLFLIKERIENILEVFTETARSRIRIGTAIVIQNQQFADGASAFIFNNAVTEPRWVADVRSSFPFHERVQSQSSSAVVVFRQSGRIFAVTFGSGWLFLDVASLVSDFGLRVALNSMDDSLLKRLDISNLGEAMKGVSQSASQRRFDTFGVDEALELVRKVSGTLRDGDFGSSITGSTSLKVVRDMTFAEITEVASQSLGLFSSTYYQDTSFRIIDNIMPIGDADIVDSLDDYLIMSIIAGDSNFELGLPEITETDVASFRFQGFLRARSYQDLLLSHYRQVLGNELQNLTADKLKGHYVSASYIDNQKPDRRLRIYDALVGSIEFDGGRYALNDGCWYRVDQQFKQSVDSIFRSSVFDLDYVPPVIITRASLDGRKQSLESEEDYNARYALDLGYLLMDQKLVSVPDVGRSSFEVCDLIDVENKRLIHVKMSGRKSSVLSHLFKQGGNSASLLRSIDAIWESTIQKVREEIGEIEANSLEAAQRDVDRPWTIEFHIADRPNSNGDYNIPFFSRVTFRDEYRRMKSMGYEVRVSFISKPAVTLR